MSTSSITSACASTRLSVRAAGVSSSSSMLVSVSPNCTWMLLMKTQSMMMPLSSCTLSIPNRPLFVIRPRSRSRRSISCEVAAEVSSQREVDVDDAGTGGAKIGARVRVKVPLKVYHVPKVPEVDLTGMEGQIKQYVGVWRGKRISANLPYKVEFLTDIQPRGPVKFFAHLKEDEFDGVDVDVDMDG